MSSSKEKYTQILTENRTKQPNKQTKNKYYESVMLVVWDIELEIIEEVKTKAIKFV